MNTPDQNKKAQQEQNFPGYPSYPASEDVTNEAEQVDYETMEERTNEIPRPHNASDPVDMETDVTPEDVAMLSAADHNRDMSRPDLEEPLLDNEDDDGDPLNEVQAGYTQMGADLDVPGSEDDNDNEAIGEEDEENNYYSLGGDEMRNIEEGENGG